MGCSSNSCGDCRYSRAVGQSGAQIPIKLNDFCSLSAECVRKVLESVILRFLITAKRLEKVLISQEIRTFLVAEAGLEPTASGL